MIEEGLYIYVVKQRNKEADLHLLFVFVFAKTCFLRKNNDMNINVAHHATKIC